MILRASTTIILAVLLCACGQPSEKKKEEKVSQRMPTEAERIKKIEEGKKRPLSHFDEQDVAKYAVALFKERSVADFESTWTPDGILVTSKSKQILLGPETKIKIGGYGLLLYKTKNSSWTDRFEDRRIFYHEKGKKLILSQTFEGDSATYQEFEK